MGDALKGTARQTGSYFSIPPPYLSRKHLEQVTDTGSSTLGLQILLGRKPSAGG